MDDNIWTLYPETSNGIIHENSTHRLIFNCMKRQDWKLIMCSLHSLVIQQQHLSVALAICQRHTYPLQRRYEMVSEVGVVSSPAVFNITEEYCLSMLQQYNSRYWHKCNIYALFCCFFLSASLTLSLQISRSRDSTLFEVRHRRDLARVSLWKR